MNETDRRVTVARDLILFVFGLAGIAYQQVTGDVNAVLLGIFTAMTGVPGLTNLVSLLRGTPTGGSSSAPAPSEPGSESERSR